MCVCVPTSRRVICMCVCVCVCVYAFNVLEFRLRGRRSWRTPLDI